VTDGLRLKQLWVIDCSKGGFRHRGHNSGNLIDVYRGEIGWFSVAHELIGSNLGRFIESDLDDWTKKQLRFAISVRRGRLLYRIS